MSDENMFTVILTDWWNDICWTFNGYNFDRIRMLL